jgi:hypothetical protein
LVADLVALISPETTRNETRDSIEQDWRTWIAQNFSAYLWPPFAPYHEAFWDWAWSIEQGRAARPFVAVWPRGFAKSTSTEVACALVAARGTRSYGLYICDTQERADDHISNVAGLLESQSFGAHYPDVADRKLGKFGNSQGWRRNRLRTKSGFTLDAIGLDTAARGVKVDEHRPDFLIFDDIDGLHDSPGTTDRKIKTITQSLLPARARHAAVLVVQNLIHETGIVARLASTDPETRADFLADRIVSGPHPAIEGLVTEAKPDGGYRIVAGIPTWPSLTIDDLQRDMDEVGLSAFLQEKQHDVDQIEGSMFQHLQYRRIAWSDLPALERTVVAVDPAVTDTDQSDAHGIQADALGVDGTIYRLFSWEQRSSPEQTVVLAVRKAIELKADTVVIETDQGGDTWISVYEAAIQKLEAEGLIVRSTVRPKLVQRKAGSIGSKSYRANLMLAHYERGGFIHVVGTHDQLERGLKRYLVRKPYDLADAAYWSFYELESRPRSTEPVPRMPKQSRWKGRA